MIITVTLNPAVDISYQLETLTLDGTNRVLHVEKTAGGKGLNVSRVLNQIGDQVNALGFIGGHIGQEISDQLTQLNIENNFTPISEQTRNCVSILHDGKQTEVLEKGPTILDAEQEEFVKTFLKHSEDASVIVFSGSLSAGLSTDFYANLLEKLPHKKIIVDTSGATLERTLQANVKPFAIKPNLEELSQLLQKEVTKEMLPTILTDEPLFKDITLICVSLGGDGAIVKYKDDMYQVTIPKIKVVSSVGSGDSVVAGLASGLQRGYAIEEWLQHAMVLGMLNAQESKTGYVNVDNYDSLKQQIVVKKIN